MCNMTPILAIHYYLTLATSNKSVSYVSSEKMILIWSTSGYLFPNGNYSVSPYNESKCFICALFEKYDIISPNKNDKHNFIIDDK